MANATSDSSRYWDGGDRCRPGIFLQLGSTDVVELIGLSGFEFAILDFEHGSDGIFGQLADTVRACELGGLHPAARVSLDSPALIQRCLDAGVRTFFVPDVRSENDIIRYASLTSFSPKGRRGSCSSVRVANYGFSRHRVESDANDAIALFAMIESPEGYADSASILSLPDLAGIIVGRQDLSVRLPGSGLSVEEVTAGVAARAKESGKLFGRYVASSHELVGNVVADVDFLVCGTDVHVFRDALVSLMSDVRSLL